MPESVVFQALLLLVTAVVGAGFGIVLERRGLDRVRGRLKAESEHARLSAQQEAEHILKTAELKGREEIQRQREALSEEARTQRLNLAELEKQASSRSDKLDRRFAELDERRLDLEEGWKDVGRRSDEVGRRSEELDLRRQSLDRREEELGLSEAHVLGRLEEVAGLSSEEARRELVTYIEEEARAETAHFVREERGRARRRAQLEARKIISQAIEKIGVDHVSENSVSAVALPAEDMKGRIIGREGRNIRAFEAATGVDLVVDDTPGVVILSCFDSVRREVGRLALERLIADGRIHPARIEEIVEKAHGDIEIVMQEAADKVMYELGVHGLHPEIRETLGYLRFRSSYGQNQLAHSREVALIAAAMAAELGLDQEATKRMGLLHDIGKGLTHLHEGSHVDLGYDLCKRCGERDEVLNAIKAHHGDEPARYPETSLVTAADAISGARPGARQESYENYVKRVERLEEIAQSCEGVERVYAIQAGREVRVIVTPDKVTDEEMAEISDRTARRIEQELQYPGQIKVVVIRESRTVDFAR